LGCQIIYNSLLAELNPLKPVIAAPLFRFSIGGHEIIFSNHMLMITVAAVILLIIIPLGVSRKSLTPRGWQICIESLCVFLRDEVARPVLGHNADRFLFFIWTIFFFILTMNLLGMVPLEAVYYLITRRHEPIGGGATTNIWITGALAMITFVLTHASGIKQHGLLKYLGSLAPKVPWPILPLIYVLEILSALVRPFALAVRLFANMVAGHIVLATFVGLILIFKHWSVATISVGAAIGMSFLELLVVFIQAYIFTLLSALFISLALESEH
jgi:F-type H+-transporting ATPase subunit a